MTTKTTLIREIKPEDNLQIEAVIRATFIEYKIPLQGTAFEDSETPNMFESYQEPTSKYYVIEQDGYILGGGGIKQLQDTEEAICEIQKMYFLHPIRGKGYGKLLFKKLLNTATTLGFKKCYLESASQLKAAIHIYEQYGFTHLNNPLGNTGHYSCGVWMIKEL